MPKTGWPKQQKFIVSQWWRLPSEIKLLAGPCFLQRHWGRVSGTSPIPSPSLVNGHLHIHMEFSLYMCLSPSPPFYKDPSHVVLFSTLMASFLT